MGTMTAFTRKTCAYAAEGWLPVAGIICFMLILTSLTSAQIAAPAILGFSPSMAPAGGHGFVLIVNGTNFAYNSVVQWNGSNRATTIVNPNLLQAEILASDTAVMGTASFAVITPGAPSSETQQFTITAPQPDPIITSITPNFAYIEVYDPIEITITGSNFTEYSYVMLDETIMGATFVNSNCLQIRLHMPYTTHSGTVNIKVVTPLPGGSESNSLVFTFKDPPIIRSLRPYRGYIGDPDFILTLTGENFTTETIVSWNNSVKPTTFVDSEHLQAYISTSDLSYQGVAAVVIDTPRANESMLAFQMFHRPAPVLGSFVPASAPAGGPGFVLMALGTNVISETTPGFSTDSVVRWNGSDRVTTFVDPQHLQAQIPASDLVSQGDASITVYTPATGATSSARSFSITEPLPSLSLSVGAGGAVSHSAPASAALKVGYATITNSGTVPFGTAVIGSRANGITYSETAVISSPPTYRTRFFIDFRPAATVIAGRPDSGAVEINTGIAVVNYGSKAANVTYSLRDLKGKALSTGRGTILAGSHFSKFVNELADVAEGFSFPTDFGTTTLFGSLEIQSDQPISVLALRSTVNQRGEFLVTTTPVADLNKPLNSSSVYFPQFADGGGYTTSLVLLNTSDKLETGVFHFIDKSGSPLVVREAGGTSDSSFRYSIPANGGLRFQLEGSSANIQSGWVQLTPDILTSTPEGIAIFGYNPYSVLISESGIPAVNSTTKARIYVDLSNGHNTGIALANPASADATISIDAFEIDGVKSSGTSKAPLTLAGHGHTARFADELVEDLPSDFRGLLEITSNVPLASLTMRFYVNERSELLMTSSPIADANRLALSPILFPQIATGEGYTTEFIFVSPSGASSLSLGMYDESGTRWEAGKE